MICEGEAAAFLFPPVFVSMAETIKSPEAPPLYLWVDLRAFPNKDGTTGLFTTGLAPLGHMEIEIPSIDMGLASCVSGCSTSCITFWRTAPCSSTGKRLA
jgi:hypothetical protein